MYLIDDCVQSVINELNKYPNRMVITDGKDDVGGRYLDLVTTSNGWYDIALYESSSVVPLCTEYPFFMGLNRDVVLKIGGYDEDFIGYAYDDTDFSRRLKQYGLTLHKLKGGPDNNFYRVVHLFHLRERKGIPNLQEKLAYNKHLYDSLNNSVYRNVGREWGVFHA
jgi:hypothetical protein